MGKRALWCADACACSCRKPSYSQLYTASNALAGHFSSFGTKVPLPKKRKDRVLQEVALAERALAAGR